MGYLTDNIPPTVMGAFCEDLYLYRVLINPGFASNLDLQVIVKDVIPDVEEWQFSGRRTRCPRTDGKLSQIVHPYDYSSQKSNEFVERVIFAFHTTLQRTDVTNRLTTLGFSFTIENEPGVPPVDEDIIIVI